MKVGRKIGFSVVELSIVMVVIGILITFSIDFISLLTKQNKIADAQEQIDLIDEALLAFVKSNGRLPCPADRAETKPDANFAKEQDCSSAVGSNVNIGATTAEIAIGAVPTRSLGLKDLDGIDPWGMKITYVVVQDLTESPDAYEDYVAATGDNGVIQIVDGGGNVIAQETTECTSDDLNCTVIAYFIFSHGENLSGAFGIHSATQNTCTASLEETENCDDADNDFVIAPFNDGDTANYFDDIYAFKTKQQIDWEVRSE